MKKLTALTAAVAMASAMQVVAEVPNGYSAYALAHVYVDVLPNISIGGTSGSSSYADPCDWGCESANDSTSGGG
ncbi:MAG: hypothetical protein HKO06_12540, partial [Pseudomonadales bacterium]|nr:hypothetical protein [Pseudomonadales bacterium]